jgi:Ribbon-helix-helix protein, copG family
VPPVKPVSVRMPDDLAVALTDEAERLGVTVTELIRQGIVLRLAFGAAVSAAEQGEDVDALLAETLRNLPRAVRRHGA